MSDDTVKALTELVVAFAVPLATGLAAVGIAYLRKQLGLTQTQNDMLAEQNARTKLQATLVTAAGMYALGQKDNAVKYVEQNAADTFAMLNVNPEHLAAIITAKAAGLAGVTAPDA